VKRLVEDPGAPESPDRFLADLIRAVDPTVPDPFRKRRVLLGVMGPRQRRASLLRPAIVVFSVVVAVTAGAALGRTWFSPAAHRASPVEPRPSRVLPTPPAAEDLRPGAPEPETQEPAQATTAPVGPRRRTTPSASERPKGEDPGALVDAIHALRTEHDPVRAGELLSRYMATYPNGVLTEDALALAIEAAVARRDPVAAEYAKRYLKQYPEGRFNKLARRAIHASGP
jgi:hypothetical protein